jgi:hypothetical protein
LLLAGVCLVAAVEKSIFQQLGVGTKQAPIEAFCDCVDVLADGWQCCLDDGSRLI